MSALLSHCGICKKALSAGQRLTGICADAECRRQDLLRQAREALRYRKAMLRKRFLEVRDQTASAAGVDHPERFPLAIVPSFVNGLIPLSDERRQRFRDNIAKVVEESWDRPPNDYREFPVSPPEEIQSFFGGACALCRGHCCRLGGDQAFFRSETVDRFRQAHPDATPEQVIEAYMDQLQEQSLENSCVYHGEQGCVLPREMRPGICNDFFCEGLWDVVSELKDADSLRMFAAQANGSYLAGAAFLDGEQTTNVDVRVGFVNMADGDEAGAGTNSN